MTKRSRKIALFIVITTSFVLSGEQFFHHHDGNTIDDQNCPACIVINALNSSDICVDAVLLPGLNIESTVHLINYTLPEYSEYFFLPSRSPPQSNSI